MRLDQMDWPDFAGQRVAFQFSGGRDSLAALWVLRPRWRSMTVYHLDTGDQFPETRAIVDWVRGHVPVQVIRADVRSFHEREGWPSDVVPVNATALGRAVAGEPVRVVSRYECCWRNLMAPMHQRMLDDGITLIVRGQRDEDYASPPARSGDGDGQVTVFYPIQHWSTADVNAYCQAQGLPMAPWYAEGAAHGSDCMHCTAWWDDGRLPYLRKRHPAVYGQVMHRMVRIGEAIERQFQPLYEGMSDG